MTHVTKKMDEDNVAADSFAFGYGREKIYQWVTLYPNPRCS